MQCRQIVCSLSSFINFLTHLAYLKEENIDKKNYKNCAETKINTAKIIIKYKFSYTT